MSIDIKGWGDARDPQLQADVRRMIEETVGSPHWLSWLTVQVYPHRGSHLCSVTLQPHNGELISLKTADVRSWRRAVALACRSLSFVARRHRDLPLAG